MKKELILSVAALAFSGTAMAQNLINNGGFESWSDGVSDGTTPGVQLAATFTDWSPVFRVDAFFDSDTYYNASSGDYFAGMAVRNNLGESEHLTQSFAVTAGQTYQLTFDMAPGGMRTSGIWYNLANSSDVGLNVDVTGAASYSNFFAVDPSDLDTSTAGNPSEWTTQSVQFTATSTGKATLTFEAHTPDPLNDPYRHIYLDEASVTQVPEPSVVALLGLAGFALIFRRRH